MTLEDITQHLVIKSQAKATKTNNFTTAKSNFWTYPTSMQSDKATIEPKTIILSDRISLRPTVNLDGWMYFI